MTSHLLGLQATNFKRLTAVELEFDPKGGVVALMGKNEAGKSSVLDAIEVAISGRKAPHPDRPVRDGADKATIVATFDDIIVTRTYSAEGKPSIEVRGTDGRRFGNTEDILRALYSHVALDPLAFSRLSEAEQVATLLPMIGFDPAPLDNERKAAFDRRTDVNREVKRLQTMIGWSQPASKDDPTEPVDVAALTDQMAVALGSIAEQERLAREVEAVGQRVERTASALEAARAALRLAETDYRASVESQTEYVQALKDAGEPLDPEPIRAQIEGARTRNARYDELQERARLAAELAQQEAQAAALTEQITDVLARREAALAAAQMPVPGLSIDPDSGVLTLKGVPFSQASTGVKIRTGTAIAMALNPDLKLIVIRDASLLDAGNRGVIDEIARANGYTVLMEIADESMPVGVVIEAGEVREVRS